MEPTLDEALVTIPDADLRVVVQAAIKSIAEISHILRRQGGDSKLDQTNAFGDTQLEIDVQADEILQASLTATGYVHTVSSEERPTETVVCRDDRARFSVAYDPLDGSSILPTNFAVGTIIGIWQSRNLLGTCGDSLVASLAAVYGPRTTVYITTRGWRNGVVEATLRLSATGEYESASTRTLPKLHEGKLFAPANLRATADNEGYARLVQFYMRERYTLRYTGGMVPDVTQILVKGFGVFASPVSETAPPKLRLLYEAMPMADLIEAAGGGSSDGARSILRRTVESCEDRTPVCLGSVAEVKRFEQFCHP